MGIVVRQGVKASVVSYVGALLGYVSWLLLIPKWLDSEEVGLVKVLGDSVILMTPFLHAGALNIIIKYYPYFTKSKVLEAKFLGYVIGLPLVASALFFGLFFIFNDLIESAYIKESPLFVQYLYYVIPLSFLAVYIQVVEFLVKSELRIAIPRFLREIVVRIGTIGVIVLYFLKCVSLAGLVQGLVVVNIVHLILLLIYYKRLKGDIVWPTGGIQKTRYFKPLVNYTLFMFMGLGGGALISRLDSIMITSIGGLTQTGIYAIAFLIAQSIELPKRAFNSIISPLVARAFREKDMKTVAKYYHRSSLNLSIISIIFFVGIWSNFALIYNFVSNKELYMTGAGVVFFIGLSKVLDMSMGVNNEIIQNSPYYKWSVYLSVAVSLIAIVTNLVFIPLWGITGAAVATFISVFLYNFTRFLILKWKMNLNPFRWNNLGILILGIICLGLTEWVSISNIYIDFVVNGGIIMLIFVLPIYLLRLSGDFNSFVKNMAARVGVTINY